MVVTVDDFDSGQKSIEYHTSKFLQFHAFGKMSTGNVLAKKPAVLYI